MANIEKFTHDAVCNNLRHNNRELINSMNLDIDKGRSDLNYSFPLDHGGLSDFQYYKKIIGEKYIYGRGTAREKKTITACGWVVTLPKELLGNPEKERFFFRGVFDFCSNRYGVQNILNNVVHYDEAGLPHIHVVFCPVTTINHDFVRYKTCRTKTAYRTETGRFEYLQRLKKDENGNSIPLKNYAKISDYFDEKVSAADVINKAELQHFHQDLQKYLSENGIEGAVLNGATGGKSMTVKSLKEFSRLTGLNLEDVRKLQLDCERIQSMEKKVFEMSEDLRNKENIIEKLQDIIYSRDRELVESTNREQMLQDKIRDLEMKYEQGRERIQDLENEKLKTTTQKWGTTQAWGRESSWGRPARDNTITFGEE